MVMVKRGHEVDVEYSKKDILDKMNNFFGYSVVEKLKFVSFDENETINNKIKNFKDSVTIDKYTAKIKSIKNEKIKNSLIEFTKNYKNK